MYNSYNITVEEENIYFKKKKVNHVHILEQKKMKKKRKSVFNYSLLKFHIIHGKKKTDK